MRLPRRALGPSILLFGILLGYFASYAALLRTQLVVDSGSAVGADTHLEADFRIGRSFCLKIFKPALVVDEWIRPAFWNREVKPFQQIERNWGWIARYESGDGVFLYADTPSAVRSFFHDLDDLTAAGFVSIQGKAFRDSHLDKLRPFKMITDLELLATGVSDTGVQRFKAARPDCHLFVVFDGPSGIIVGEIP